MTINEHQQSPIGDHDTLADQTPVDTTAEQPEDTSSVAVPAPNAARTPLVPPEAALKGTSRRAQVHVADNLLDLVTISADSGEATARKQQHDLNHLVHQVLIIGLVVSTALMVLGVVLDIFLRREIPQTIPSVRDVLQRVLSARPSGFLSLGLLVLIATPVLRVIGSIGAFVYEREWRYAAITVFVLSVMIVSMLLGHG